MLLRLKPARKSALLIGLIASPLLLTGCPQQQVHSPAMAEIAERQSASLPIPQILQSPEASLTDNVEQNAPLPLAVTNEPKPSQDVDSTVVAKSLLSTGKDSENEFNRKPVLSDWLNKGREIARTELQNGKKVGTNLAPQSTPIKTTVINRIDATPIPINQTGIAQSETSQKEPNPIFNSPNVTAINPISISPMDETPEITAPIELARLNMSRGEPETAINILNAINLDGLEQAERSQILEIKSAAFRRLNFSMAALRIDADRVQYLENPVRSTEIERILFKINQLPSLIRDDLTRGADILAGLAAAQTLSVTNDHEATIRWLRKFQTHPLLDAEISRFSFLKSQEMPKVFHVTVLLPLSGDLSTAGRAIRDGILFAYSKSIKSSDMAISIRDSMTVSDGELKRLTQGETTEFIIGPLQRNQIDRILSMNPIIPVLALNRFNINKYRSVNKAPIYSLSLSIEDDAESAVAYASDTTSEPRILSLYSNSPLGLRASDAIKKLLNDENGSSAGQSALDQKKPGDTIATSLGVTDSKNRKTALSRLLKLKLEHTPRIRQDLTAVIVQTNPRAAQQLRPLFDFYYLGQTPLILIGAYRSDLAKFIEDFHQTTILATPWELGSAAKDSLKNRPLTLEGFGTLTAIGSDAMKMAFRLGFGFDTSFQGETGYLTLRDDSTIKRRLGKLDISQTGNITQSVWPTEETPKAFQLIPNAR
ncbi:penicillin-binding protein activator [Litorivicinus sp.]|nr:penicillin-binding protein activator [Litorivicinus sp.]